ncbi:MAG: DHH family phosphoesterase [Patescibacteria group bacterium]|uniref:Uncharacterized protein n=1 Tax=candidate division WWE3 bacterium TaxID=2053526 RepID=A0A955EAZ5_UNCKA|nr:hypothetical protein [candidate division WWE3 bacterium]
MPTNNSPQEIWDALKQAKNPICFLDGRLDFDSVCSALIVKELLSMEGVELPLYWHSFYVADYKKYFEVDKITPNVDPTQFDFTDYDLLLFLDCGDAHHLAPQGNFVIPSHIKTVNIDHHTGNPFYGDLNYVLYRGSNTSVLYNFFLELDLTLSPKLLKYIAMSLLTDTGFLKYDTVTSDDFRLIATLVDSGISIFDIIYELSFFLTPDAFRLNKLILNNMRVEKEGRFVYTTITQDELAKYNIDEYNVKGGSPSDYLRRYEGMRFAFSITERNANKGLYSVSFRSSEKTYDVEKLAKSLGGGGHTSAAGVKIVDPVGLDSVINTVLSAIYMLDADKSS